MSRAVQQLNSMTLVEMLRGGGLSNQGSDAGIAIPTPTSAELTTL